MALDPPTLRSIKLVEEFIKCCYTLTLKGHCNVQTRFTKAMKTWHVSQRQINCTKMTLKHTSSINNRLVFYDIVLSVLSLLHSIKMVNETKTNEADTFIYGKFPAANCLITYQLYIAWHWIIPNWAVLFQQRQKHLRHFFVKDAITTPVENQCLAIGVTHLHDVDIRHCTTKLHCT